MTMSIPVARPENHCRRKGCECLHDGCVHGWIDFTDHDGKEWTKPCPTCRWDRQGKPGEAREDWLARLRDQDGAWSRRLDGGVPR
ncbi:MAG TPA: hypothetical protein VIS06_04630 [Mycobacteriales bacterium]|jgi:hypothetical protein